MLMLYKLRAKLKKALKDKTGMTLVELMMSFSLLTIVMLMSISILMFTSNMYNRAARLNITKLSSDELFGYIENRLTFAGHIEVLPYASGIGAAKYENVITVIDGKLYSGKKADMLSDITQCDILQDNAYADSDLQLTVSKKASTVLDLNLEMYKDGECQYQTQTSMQILSMLAAPGIAKSAYIEPSSFSSDINPIISYDNGASFTFKDGGGPYTVDQQYDPDNQDPPATVIEYYEGMPLNCSPGTYLKYNNKLYHYPADTLGGSNATLPPSPTGQWWVNVDDPKVDTDTTYVDHNAIYDEDGYYMYYTNGTGSATAIGWEGNYPHNLLVYSGGNEVSLATQSWAKVYWNGDMAEDDHREYGWSLIQESAGYLRAVDFNYNTLVVYKLYGTIPDGVDYRDAEGNALNPDGTPK